MEFGDFVSEDAPDPADAVRDQVRALGVPIAGFVPQPHLEEEDGLSTAMVGSGDRAEIARSYRLWRNPDDRSDPANLAELDEAVRRSLDEEPLVPLPPWLLAARERARYPLLWEAVRTAWTAAGEKRPDPVDCLVAHAEHLLHNGFREELAIPFGEWRSLVPRRALQPHPVLVDGVPIDGLLLDTDPFVLGVAARLAPDRVLSAVVPREHLELVTLEFVADAPLER